MTKDLSYHDFIIHDVLGDIPDISSRHMMSGWCIYKNKIPVGAIIDNQFYIKAKGKFAEELQGMGWEQFSYEKSDNKVITMSYHAVPEEYIENHDKLLELITTSYLDTK
jgi:TfoX/Sxy family transcriptional regulator of competence genes